MKLRVHSLVGVVLLGAALASTPSPTNSSTGGCTSGSASGVFDLPSANQNGVIDGVLLFGGSNQVAYAMSGSLTFVASPCLSCVEGRLTATLDDGVGTGPDLVVHGRYLGGWMSGTGQFIASVDEPNGTERLGKLVGTFTDPPSQLQPGHFDGAWRICH